MSVFDPREDVGGVDPSSTTATDNASSLFGPSHVDREPALSLRGV